MASDAAFKAVMGKSAKPRATSTPPILQDMDAFVREQRAKGVNSSDAIREFLRRREKKRG